MSCSVRLTYVIFITLNACGFVRELSVAEMPNALKLWHKNGNDALGRRVSRNADTFDYNVRSEVVGESSPAAWTSALTLTMP